ncbi:hypothetical protein [Streptomyces sp. NPDC006551]|uniref:hypothetical protein n=1 Tax=Streptomyces sp. NPDC006551 TaxID=3157178 RepID=UPI0033B3D009
MASRSRKYTRPGADPEGRFRPVATPEQKERAEELVKALAPVQPSAVVRSAAWYGTSREDAKLNLPGFWIAFFAVTTIGTWLLTML